MFMSREPRDRERVMRTLEKSDTPILTGMQIYHNYMRPDDALKGKLRARVLRFKLRRQILSAIGVGGENRWTRIIQNTAKGKLV